MKFLGAASIYFVSNVVNAGIPFLLLPILTRILTPSDYGAVTRFVVMVSLFSVFAGLSVHGAVWVRYFQLSKENFSEYVSTCVGLLIVSTIFILLVLIIFQHWIVSLSGLSVDWLIAAVLVSGAQFIINIRLSIWQVTGLAWHYGGLQVFRSTVDAFLTLILLFGVGMAWQGRLLGMVASIVLIASVGVFWLYRDGFLTNPGLWRVHSKDAINFGVPLIPHTVGSMLIVLTDRLIINKQLGSDAVGIYMVALQMGMVISLVTESFNKAFGPWLYGSLNKKSDTLNLKIVKGTYVYFLLIIIAGFVYGLISPYFMPYFVGEKFWGSGHLVIYIALGFSFGGCYYMVTNYIFYTNKNIILAIVTISAGIVNLPITSIMVDEFGIVGAAVSFMVVNFVVFVGTWLAASKVHRMPWFLVKG